MNKLNKCELLNILKDCIEDINGDGEEGVVHLNGRKMVNRHITISILQTKTEIKFDNLDKKVK